MIRVKPKTYQEILISRKKVASVGIVKSNTAILKSNIGIGSQKVYDYTT